MEILYDSVDEDLFKSNVYVCKRGYAEKKKRVNGKNKHIMLHQVIAERMYGDIKGYEVDHINNNKLDNRRCNLRLVTHAQNNINKPVQSNNKLGIKNIHYSEARKRYVLQITYNGKKLVKYSKDLDSLIILRDEWLKENVKEYSYGFRATSA